MWSSMQFSLTDDTTYCGYSSEIAAAVHCVSKATSTSSSSSSIRSWERCSSMLAEDADKRPACNTPDSSLLDTISNNNNCDQAPNKNSYYNVLSGTPSATAIMSIDVANITQTTSKGDDNSVLPVHTMETFFSSQKYRFSDIELTKELGIPTAVFLEACRGITSLFDLLGSTTFAPVKMDMNGNIGKLQKKYDSNPAKFAFLQSMMRNEMENNTTRVRNSSTDALLWLKRALEFIYEFFVLMLRGDPDLTNCVSAAYTLTLRKYHGWMARGLFAVATRAIPYRNDFIRLLMLNIPAEVDTSQFEQQVHSDCVDYMKHMSIVLKVINRFYQENNLDSSDVV